MEAVIESVQAVPAVPVAEILPVEPLQLARGWVYILLNSAMPDLVKIGYTIGPTKDRARQISAETGVPLPYSVAYDEELVFYEEAEAEIHKRLARFRVNRQREFFSVPLKEAIRVVQEVVAEYRKREVIVPVFPLVPQKPTSVEPQIAIVHPPVTTLYQKPTQRPLVFEDDYFPRRHRPDFTSWHVLHCVMTLATCGLWAPVWLIHWANWQSTK